MSIIIAREQWLSPTISIGATRTIITGEGGAGPSRSEHIIKTESGRGIADLFLLNWSV